jgi:hypothetical protein
MAKRSNLHVVQRNDGWGVRREGNSRDSIQARTQQEAIDLAQQTARNEGGEVIIHGRNGQIRDRDSYGNDPHPPKG